LEEEEEEEVALQVPLVEMEVEERLLAGLVARALAATPAVVQVAGPWGQERREEQTQGRETVREPITARGEEVLPERYWALVMVETGLTD